MGKPQKSSAGEDLHTAARSGDLNAVQSILSSNPLAINSRDKHSRTPYPLLYLFIALIGFFCVVLFGSRENMTKEYTILSSEVYLIRYLCFSFISDHELGERQFYMTQSVTFSYWIDIGLQGFLF